MRTSCVYACTSHQWQFTSAWALKDLRSVRRKVMHLVLVQAAAILVTTSWSTGSCHFGNEMFMVKEQRPTKKYRWPYQCLLSTIRRVCSCIALGFEVNSVSSTTQGSPLRIMLYHPTFSFCFTWFLALLQFTGRKWESNCSSALYKIPSPVQLSSRRVCAIHI